LEAGEFDFDSKANRMQDIPEVLLVFEGLELPSLDKEQVKWF
jgi:hypothetical protein